MTSSIFNWRSYYYIIVYRQQISTSLRYLHASFQSTSYTRRHHSWQHGQSDEPNEWQRWRTRKTQHGMRRGNWLGRVKNHRKRRGKSTTKNVRGSRNDKTEGNGKGTSQHSQPNGKLEINYLFISPKYIGTVCVAFQKMGRDASQNRLHTGCFLLFCQSSDVYLWNVWFWFFISLIKIQKTTHTIVGRKFEQQTIVLVFCCMCCMCRILITTSRVVEFSLRLTQCGIFIRSFTLLFYPYSNLPRFYVTRTGNEINDI